MTMTKCARLIALGSLVVSGLAISGCISSPTYGTDKTSTEQLVSDVTGILSMAPKPKPKIDYDPRPELVRPASMATLPPPQENIVAADSAAWPESPEQKRARVRQYATENRDKQGFEPLVVSDVPAVQATSGDPDKLGESARAYDSGVRESVTKKQSAAYQQAKVEQQGTEAERKYLSEPPLVYRQPEATAAVGELGEEEVKKARRKRKEAMKDTGFSSWIPDIFE